MERLERQLPRPGVATGGQQKVADSSWAGTLSVGSSVVNERIEPTLAREHRPGRLEEIHLLQ